MQEIGYTLASPYKIVAYMQDIGDISMVQERYAKYNPVFDRDILIETQKKISIF
jgi:hypothetical protein